MFRRLRTVFTALAVGGLLVAHAGPASAGKLEEIDRHSVPPMLDLVLLRPMGLAFTALGTAAFVPAGAATALFAPKQMEKSFDLLVRGPFEYTFRDPLGSHGGRGKK